MKKLVLVLGSLLVLCILVSPKLVGHKIASSINEAVDAINEKPGYRAEVVTLESGWFKTTADIQLAADFSMLAGFVDDQSDEIPELQITLDASHGPVRFGDKAGIGWAAWSADVAGGSLRDFFDWEQHTPLYHMDGSVSLLGDIDYSQAVQTFTAEFPIESENTHVSISGRQGDGGGDLEAYYSDMKITTPQGTVSANFNSNLVGAKSLPVTSLNDIDFWVEHMRMAGNIHGDKAATEFLLATFFKKQYENYKIPRNMSKEDIQGRAKDKMQFALAVMTMEKVINATDSHYNTALNLEDNQLSIHKKTISLPLNNEEG